MENNTLILNGKRWELVETTYPDWLVHTDREDVETYKDFGFIKKDINWDGINVWYCKSIGIGVKFYGVKPIKNGE